MIKKCIRCSKSFDSQDNSQTCSLECRTENRSSKELARRKIAYRKPAKMKKTKNMNLYLGHLNQ
jgi:hypothetical protein